MSTTTKTRFDFLEQIGNPKRLVACYRILVDGLVPSVFQDDYLFFDTEVTKFMSAGVYLLDDGGQLTIGYLGSYQDVGARNILGLRIYTWPNQKACARPLEKLPIDSTANIVFFGQDLGAWPSGVNER